MFVSDFCYSNNDFPEEFYESLPKTCPDCGAPMEMSEALTQLHCSNLRCTSKVAQRLVAMANDLGVKDLGEARANKLVNTFSFFRNPLLIFQYEPKIDGAMGDGISVETSQAIVDQFMRKNRMTLFEYVKIAHLPNIQTSAQAIFGKFDSLDDAYAKIEEGGVDYICECLNIAKGSDISIRAVRVYETLVEFKKDLYQAIDSVEIIKTHSEGMMSLTAVCSDEVGQPFRTKADFYATVNNLFPNIHVEFLSAVTKNIDYLVWAGANGKPARYTNKVKKVESYNKQYEEHLAAGTLKEGEHKIPIVVAGDFIRILEEMAGNK